MIISTYGEGAYILSNFIQVALIMGLVLGVFWLLWQGITFLIAYFVLIGLSGRGPMRNIMATIDADEGLDKEERELVDKLKVLSEKGFQKKNKGE